ncbi:MAG: hypothetical protein ACP5MB_06095 [bacterium]
MVYDYDLFVLETSLSTTAASLAYYGQNAPGTTTPWYVPTPGSYVQKVHKFVITNTGTGTATVTLTGASTVSGNPTLTLLTISVPAGATVTYSEEDFDIILPESYYLQGVISAGSGYAFAEAYFVKG